MKKQGQFPEGWNFFQIPEHYYYKSQLINHKDRDKFIVELVVRDEDEIQHSVLAKRLREAIKKLQRRL